MVTTARFGDRLDGAKDSRGRVRGSRGICRHGKLVRAVFVLLWGAASVTNILILGLGSLRAKRSPINDIKILTVQAVTGFVRVKGSFGVVAFALHASLFAAKPGMIAFEGITVLRWGDIAVWHSRSSELRFSRGLRL